MYVKEMHIEVRQSMQKIAANKTRKLYDAEIDWLLNKNMQRFIQSRVTPKKDGSGGFEITQFDLDAIRTLLKTRVHLVASKHGSKRYASILPGDYSYLIGDLSLIKRACSKAPSTSIVTENILVIPLKKSTGTAPYYTAFTITINSVEEFNITTYTQERDTQFTGYTSAEEIYEITDAMIRYLNDKGFNAYWEQYGDSFYPKSLIIVSAGAITGSANIDSVVSNGVLKTRAYTAADIANTVATESANGLTPSNQVQDLQEVAFYGTSPEIPISELAGNNLYVYADKTFIVSKTLISYVRKPRRISITLGQDCELAPDFHQSICDLTVEYIKGMIADPNWEVKLKDNITRTPV